MQPLIPYFEVVKFPITDSFAVHGFGILVALGFVVGAKIAMGKATRDGLDPEVINRLVGWLVAGVFVGGHWGHLLMYYPEQIAEDPMNLVRFWQGLSSFGGFIGCTILGIWFFRRENAVVRKANKARKAAGEALLPRQPIWGYADACMYGFTVGWASGRTGCFVAHDHPGSVTEFALGVKGMMNPNTFDSAEKLAWLKSLSDRFPELSQLTVVDPIPAEIWQQVAYHDLGLYEVIWSLAMFGVFFVLDKKPRPPGFFVGLIFLCYGPVRLAFDLFRHPSTDTRYLGLTPAQYLSVAMALIGAWILFSKRGQQSIREAMAERKAAGLITVAESATLAMTPPPQAGEDDAAG